MKIIKKCFLIISFVILISFTYFLIRPAVVEANTGTDFIKNVEDNANSLITMGEKGLEEKGITIKTDIIKGIGYALYVILVVVVICGTLYLGISYGSSNAADRAAAKMKLLRWIIWSIVAIGSYPVFKLIVTAFDSSSYTANIVEQLGNTTEGLGSEVQNSTFALIMGTLYRFVQVAAIGYILIRFTYLAIKYFKRTASPEERAEIRHGDLQTTFVQAVLIFGAFGFIEIIYQAFYG